MPQALGKVPSFSPPKDIQVLADSFNGGLDTLLRPTEIKDNELAQADNIMLVGKGVPTGRWGSEKYFLAGAGKVRLLDSYINVQAGQNDLLAISDLGYLVKKVNASYSLILGASFPSGMNYQGIQLANNYYLAAASLPFVKYNGTALIPYLQLATPSLASIAILSAASGLTNVSWRITALSRTGETIGSPARVLASQPLDLTKTAIRLHWLALSAASGDLTGYNIYRGQPGEESFIASVGPTVNEFIDTGYPQSDTVLLPTSDTTAGIRAKYILKFDDRIVLAGIEGNPNIVYVSARYPFHDRFTFYEGGGYIYISPDDGDQVMGLGIAGNQGMSTGGSVFPPSAILVYKKNSVHRLSLAITSDGYLDPQAQLLTSSNGCSSGDTIVPVENDTFYFGDKGLFTVGQEPTYLNQIRTNELSARIRPYMENLSASDRSSACATYINNKYLLSFPLRKEVIVYDRERLCFIGPWKTPYGITKWHNYRDSSGNEHWLAGGDDAYVHKFSTAYKTDDGTAIYKVLRTKKFDFGAWSIMKILKLFYALFRNVRGEVTVNLLIEGRTGSTSVSKNFTVTTEMGTGGWGSDQWGSIQWGDTEATIVLTGEELVRRARLFKQIRVAQVEIITNSSNSQFEFLGLRMTAQALGDDSLPSSTSV